MNYIKKNVKSIIVFFAIIVFTAFSFERLKYYGIIKDHWYLGLIPFLFLVPFSFFTLSKKREAHTLIIIILIILALLYMVAVPLLQVSDESLHYLRSFEIASFKSPKIINGDIGDYLPAGLLPREYDDFQNTNYQDIKDAFDSEINKSNEIWYSFPGSALYSPFTYMPQAIGIFIAKLFTNNANILLYAGRLSNLLIVSFIAFLAVKLFPYAKSLPILLLGIWIYVQKVGSMSADGFTIAIILLFISYVLHLQYAKDGILTAKEIIPIYFLIYFISQCKIVYLPVCLLFLIISQKRFGSTKRYIIHLSALVILALAGSMGWLAISSKYLSNGYANSSYQIQTLLTTPLEYIKILLRTFEKQGKDLLEQMIGIGMGVGGVRNRRMLVYAYLVLTLGVSFIDKRTDTSRPKKDAMISFISALSVVLLTCTALYVQWTEPNSLYIAGLQGRYFIPIFYLLTIGILQMQKLDIIRHEINYDIIAILAFGFNLTAVVSCFAYGMTLMS